MPRVGILVGAFAVWLLAVIGAIGIAFVLKLSTGDAVLLVGAVASFAIFGALIPTLRLGRKS